MKKFLSSLYKVVFVVLFLFAGKVWGQISESFANIPTATPASYLARTWTGDGGGTWNATAARTDQTLTGKAICTNGSSTVTSPSVSGGMGTLSFNYVRGFTGTAARSFTVWVNGTQMGGTTTVSATSNTVQSYSQVINVTGSVQLEIRTSGAQIIIDDINWDGYISSSNTISTGTITGSSFCVTSAGAAVLVPFTSVGTFNAGNIYTAQLSNASGSFTSAVNIGTLTSTANSGTISATIPAGTASGTGYRIRVISSNPSVSGSDNGSDLVINQSPSITAQPSAQSAITGNTAVFSVSASNATSYQWQVSTDNGTSWNNVSAGTGGTTLSYMTPSATLAMNGYQYRVVLGGNSPCGNVTSNAVTLSVTTGPCYTENFSSIGTATTYGTRTWLGAGGTWTATDAREDQSINGKAITIRNGVLTSPAFPSGVSKIVFKAKFPYSETTGDLVIKVNGTTVGTLLYSEMNGTNVITKTISNIQIGGNVVITATSTVARYTIDDFEVYCNTDPYISVTPTTVPAMSATVGGAADTKTIQVSGGNLTQNITATITGTGASQFSINPTSFAQSGGTVSATNATVTYTPSATPATHNAVLTLSSTGVPDVVINLAGTTTDLPTGGDAILTFDFAGYVGDEMNGNSNFNITPGLTSSTITRGSGISAAGNSDRFNATGWTTSATVDLNDYMQFTVTPESGYQFNVTTIETKIQKSSTGPTKVVLRSNLDNYTANIDGIKDLTSTSADFTFNVNQNLSQNAVIYRVYMYNAGAGTGSAGFEGTGNDIIVSGNVLPLVTCTYPTAQASNFASSNISNNTATVSWTNGNGNRVLVVAKEGALVNQDPLSGSSYTANSVFGSGSQIGVGNFVVYDGTGTSVNITGLLEGKTYYFAIYAYNDADKCYNPNQLTGNLTTFVKPSVPLNLTKLCTTGSTQELSWAAPDGVFDGYLLVVRQGGTPNAVTSINASTQTQNLDYTLAPVYTSPSRVLYIGTSTNVTVTGLTANQSYTFALYAYKNNPNSSTADKMLYSTATTTTQIIGVSDVSYEIGTGGDSTANISWQNPVIGCYDEVLAVVTSTPGITFVPTGDGSQYTANSVYSAPNQVVYKGTGNVADITSLVNGTTYYVEIFVRKGTLWSKGVEVQITPSSATVFKGGELFFVGYNGKYKAGSNTDDQYLVATLVDIKPGTEFSLVNSRYEAGAAANVRTNKWGGAGDRAELPPGVAVIRFNGPGIIPKGSVMVFDTDGTDQVFDKIFIIDSDDNTKVADINNKRSLFTAFLQFGTGTSPNISTTQPDQIFLVQGNFVSDGTIDVGQANYILNGTLLHGLSNQANWVPLTSANSGGTASANRTSRLPASLQCFNLYYPSSTTIAGYYENDKLHNGSIRDVLLSVNNSNNWTYLNSGSYNLEPATYDDLSAGRTFTISGGNPAGTWVATSDTNWFNCNNWENFIIPDKKTDVFIGAAGTVDATISATATNAALYDRIAEVKNITISGNKLNITGNINNRLDVFGSLNINSTGILNMDDGNSSTSDGIINLYGNWNNNVGEASFKEGNGTVYFNGSSPQIINSNNHASSETFGNIVLNNNFDTTVSNDITATGTMNVITGKTIKIGSSNFFDVKNLDNQGILAVESDGNLVQKDNTGTYVGNSITVKRNALIPSDQYMYWASPVTFDSGNMLNIYPNIPKALYYSESTAYFYNSSGANIPGRGLALKGPSAGSSSVTALFKGKPFNSLVEIPLTYSGALYGYNLVGNPFPSNIDLRTLYDNNTDKIGTTFWFWDNTGNGETKQLGTGYNGNAYAKYNVASGTPTPAVASINNPLKYPSKYAVVGQGFMVRALSTLSTTDKKLKFTNTARKHDQGVFFNRVANEDGNQGKYWLRLVTPKNIGNVIAVTYSVGATNGFENFDSKQNSSTDMFYSIADQEKLAIQGREYPFVKTDIVPLGSSQYESGTHKIEIVRKEGIFENGQNIYLKDKQTGITTNLSEGSYTFEAQVGETTGRFEIIYEPENILATGGNTKEEIQVYRDGNEFVIKSQNKKLTALEVYDSSGRMIYKTDLNSTKTILPTGKMINGMYILKIHRNAEIISKKIIK